MNGQQILKKYLVISLILGLVSNSCAQEHKRNCLSYFVDDVLHTSVDFNREVFFSWDSLKVIVIFTPLYVTARLIDQNIHNRFYCPQHHKNINQLPRCCYNFADVGLPIALVGLSMLSLYPYNDELQATAQVFAVSLPFTWIGKKILKTFKTPGSLRPPNQLFNKHKRTFGGCPSGHMMEAVYMATLFGMRLGPKWGVPLGIFAAALFVDFTTCNRHFLSQLIAGAGLGVIYAVAANKVITTKLSCDFSCTIVPEPCGLPSVQFCYRF